MMILRGVTLFPYYDLGGAVENFQRKWHSAWAPGIGGANHFFSFFIWNLCVTATEVTFSFCFLMIDNLLT